MLARAVRSYLALRRAAGFQLNDADVHLKVSHCIQTLGVEPTSMPTRRSSGRVAGARSYSERGAWATSFASLGICTPRTLATRFRPPFSVPRTSLAGLPTFLPTSRSGSLSSWRHSPVPDTASTDLQYDVRVAVVHRTSCLRGHPAAVQGHHVGWPADLPDQVPEEPARSAA